MLINYYVKLVNFPVIRAFPVAKVSYFIIQDKIQALHLGMHPFANAAEVIAPIF